MVKCASTVVVALGLSVAAGCAQIPPERQLIQDAATDLGGADRIRAAKPLVFWGEDDPPNAGQNKMPDSELPVWKVTEFKRIIDLANGRTRVQQLRTAQFMFAGATVQRQHQGLDGDVAYNVGADGNVTRAGEQAAAARRMEVLHHPIPIVLAALDPSSMLTNVRQQGNEQLVDMKTAKGDVLTLGFDTTTKLPSSVRSMSYNPNMGDVAIVTTFSGYEDVGGLKL